MRLPWVAVGVVGVLFMGTMGVGLLSACGSDATTGARLTLKTRFVADDGIASPFTNAYGWSIRLDRVALSVGALYYFDGAPILSYRAPRSRGLNVLAELLGPRVAYAHPGHYQAGDAVGQMLVPAAVDLAAGPADLAAGEGTTGTFRSARFIFGETPSGSVADVLGPYVVVLEGKGTKGAMVRAFRGVADILDVEDGDREPRLEGCAFDKETVVGENGTITVHVKPSVWLDQVDLEELAESAGDPVEISREHMAFEALTRGLKKGAALVFSYTRD